MDLAQTEGPATAPSTLKHAWRSRRAGGVFAITALLALALGGSVASAASPLSAESASIVHVTSSAAADDAFSKFESCMSEHGIDMSQATSITVSSEVDGTLPAPPDGTVVSGLIVASGTAVAIEGSGELLPTDPKFEAAHEACLPILEDAGIGVVGPDSVMSGSGTIILAGPDAELVPLPAPEGNGKP